MSDGYTYTVISAHPGEPTRIEVSFYLDDRAWISVPGAGSSRPHLHVVQEHVSVSIGPSTETVTAQDVALARQLAAKAARYAAEVERLAAEHTQPGEGNTAA